MAGTQTSENYRLRAALTKAGLLPDDLANQVEVDVKTVQRWLGGRVPHPRHRTRVAQTLGIDELELWPDATPTQATEDPLKEIAGAWPHSADPDVPDWRALLDAATDRIELLDYTLAGIITEPGVAEQLAAKAARGTEIRILIAHPQSAHLAVHHQELHRASQPDAPDDRPPILSELDHTTQALRPLLTRPGIQVRQHVAERFNTILRFDDELLLTLHLYGLATSQAPTLHLRRRQDAGLFDQITNHFQRIWENASAPPEPDHEDDDVDPASEHAANGPPTPQQAQQALTQLRAHRPV